MKKIILNFVLRNKAYFYLFLITHALLLNAPPRVEILKRSSSEGTGRIVRPLSLTIDISQAKVQDSPLSAKFDDFQRTQKVWVVLKNLAMENNLPPFSYDTKRELYVSSPLRNRLSPDEISQVSNYLFPRSVDKYLENHALCLDFADGRKNLYLPGVSYVDDQLLDSGYFEYRLKPQATGFSLPETTCYHRKFNPVKKEDFTFDDTLLQTFNESPLTAPTGWDTPEVKKVFTNLKQVQDLLVLERCKLEDDQTFLLWFLRNLRTLLIGQAKLALTQAPYTDDGVFQKLQSKQKQINSSKDRIFGSVESLHDLDSTKEVRDHVSIIDTCRQLQVADIMAAMNAQRNK